MDSRRVLLVVVAALVVLSAFASVGALAQTENESANETRTDDGTTGPGLGPDAGGSGGEGGGDGGGLVDTVVGTAQGVGSAGFQEAADFALGPVFTFVLDVPVLEIGISEPGPLHPPDNWPYSALFSTIYVGIALPLTAIVFVTLTFASFGMAPLASMPWFPWSTHGLLSRGVRALVAIIGGIALHLFLFAVVHDLFAGFVNGVAPSPGDMIAEMGLLEFSLATALTGMGLYELGWDIVKWVGIEYGVIWLWLAFFPMFSMPFTATWLYSPRSTLGKFCGYLHLIHLGLLISKAAAALELYAASQLDWAANFEGVIAAFVSLALMALALATPPAVLIIMILSKNRLISALSVGAGAAAGSTLAAKANESEYIQKKKEKAAAYKEEKKEAGKSYTKRKAASAQGKYWDVKNRAQTLGSVASGSAAGVAYAGKERFNRWRSDEPGVGSSSKTATDGGVTPSRSERMRRFEEMNDRAGGLTATQRKRYFNMQMEEQGAFDSGLNTSDNDTESRRNN